MTTTAPDLLLEREQLHRRSLRVLVASQVLGGAGLGAGVTVGALLAEDMLGATELSGLPAALFTVGSAGAALLVGGVSERHGRRPGLAAGYLVGALGGLGIVLAAVLDSVLLLLPSLLVYGSGASTNLQARYAGGDLAARTGAARRSARSWSPRPSARWPARTSWRPWGGSRPRSASRRWPGRSCSPPSRTPPPRCC
jgi:MFS family permease